MHIYFTGTATAQRSLQSEYQNIISILQRQGHVVWADSSVVGGANTDDAEDKDKAEANRVGTDKTDAGVGARVNRVTDAASESASAPPTEITDDHTNFFQSIEKHIHACDVVVVEASYPTTVMYHELSYAVEMKKPILALYIKESTSMVKPLILGESDAIVIVKSYTQATLKKTLEAGVGELLPHTQESFSFSLTPMLQTYLAWVSEHKKVNRSSYIRGLLEEKMKKDVAYKDFLKQREGDEKLVETENKKRKTLPSDSA